MTDKERALQLLTQCQGCGLSKKALLALQAVAAEHAALTKARKGTGRRAGSPRGAKAKGREGVLQARAWILQVFPELKEDDLLIQTTSVGGQDIHLSPVARGVFPFAVESKRVEKLNIWEALHQADRNAQKKGLQPVLFFSRGRSDLFIAFRATDLVGWLAQYAALRGVLA